MFQYAETNERCPRVNNSLIISPPKINFLSITSRIESTTIIAIAIITFTIYKCKWNRNELKQSEKTRRNS